MNSMLNAFDVIRANPTAKRFEIGEILFAQFDCPAQEEPLGIWSQTDHPKIRSFDHIVQAKKIMRIQFPLAANIVQK